MSIKPYTAKIIKVKPMTHRSYHVMVLLLLRYSPMFVSPHTVRTQRVMVGYGLSQAGFLTLAAPARNSRNVADKLLTMVADAAGANFLSDEIFAKTRLNGAVRVIVQVQIPAGPDETRDQRIDAARQGLLRELAPVAHRFVRSYTAISALALEASHAAPCIKPGPMTPSVNGVRDRERE